MTFTENPLATAGILPLGVTNIYPTLHQFLAGLKAERGNQTYGRYDNRDLNETEMFLENYLGVERALTFASGMAAISSTIHALVKPGTGFVYSNQCYRLTDQLFKKMNGQYGIPVTGLSPEEFTAQNWKQLTEKNNHTVIFIETPSNPLLKLIDVEKINRELNRLGLRERVTVIIDSTMATPYLFRPRKSGADIEIHSATKYMGGHDDIFLGIVVGPYNLLEPVHFQRSVFGGISNPNDLAKLQNYIGPSGKEFESRMAELSKRGLAIAVHLENHETIRELYYPGLPSSADYPLALRWLREAGIDIAEGEPLPFGSVVSFSIEDNPEKIETFADAVGLLAVNFGGIHTIYDPFGVRIAEDFRKQLGINSGLFRLSVGNDKTVEQNLALLDKGLSAI